MMSVFVCMLMIAALVFIAAKASLKLFLLTGTISGKNGELVSLVSELGNTSQVLCSVIIQNNAFRLSCRVAEVADVYLIVGEGKNKMMYPMLLKEGHFRFCERDGVNILKLCK